MKNTSSLTFLAKRVLQFPAWCLIKAIRFYQRFISPMFRPSCRFYPSCSQYALTAIREHGALQGCWYAVCRICKCHPLHPGGVDFVPGTAPEQSKVVHEQP